MVVRAAQLPEIGEVDQIVRLHGMNWWQFEAVLAIRGDNPAPKLAYANGTIELMSPSRRHERAKSSLGRLVEAYCFERGVYFDPVASTTLKNEAMEKGIEPDESYAFKPNQDVPDLAIEVVLTSGGLDKLELYAALGVEEVWILFGERLEMYARPKDRPPTGQRSDYDKIAASQNLPELTVDRLQPYAIDENVFEAVQSFRRSLLPSPSSE